VLRRIPALFLNRYNARYERSARLMESGQKALQEFIWPGNVCQLQHLMERLTILAPNGRIDEAAVDQALSAMGGRAEAEEDQIRKVLAATGGNESRAAQIRNCSGFNRLS
jgi:transcriptional regulator of acetoin/glycerol metabolism